MNWRSITEIEEEIKLLNQLKENGISISYPLLDKESNYIQKLNAPEGERLLTASLLLLISSNGQNLFKIM